MNKVFSFRESIILKTLQGEHISEGREEPFQFNFFLGNMIYAILRYDTAQHLKFCILDDSSTSIPVDQHYQV